MEDKIINNQNQINQTTNQNQINQNQIIDENDYEIYVSNQSGPKFNDLHYFNWCQQTAFKYWQSMQQCNQRKDLNGYQKNGRKWQDFFLDNGNGINFDGLCKVDLSVLIPANLSCRNIFKQFYWSVCENMRLFADDVAYYLWLRIYKKHIVSKLKTQKFNNINELKNGLDNAFENNLSWKNFIEKLKESRITFANIYDETHTQELFKLFNELYKSMPKEIQIICNNVGKERFLLLLKSIYAKFLDFNGKEHDFQNDINLDDKVINDKILEARKEVRQCWALYKLFIKDKIEYYGLDNGKIVCLRNDDLLKCARESKDGLFYNNDVKMRTGWNNLKDKPLGKLNEKIRNVTWMNYANWDFQDFDGINGRLPGYYDKNGNFVEGKWRWFSQQFDVMINYYDSDVNDLCDWIHTNNDPNRKLSMPLVGNQNPDSRCYFNAANVSELGNPINLMFNFKLGHAILIQNDSKSNLSSYGRYNLIYQTTYYADNFLKLDTIYQDNFKEIQEKTLDALKALQAANKKNNNCNSLKEKYEACLILQNEHKYNLSYISYVRLLMDVHLLNIKSNSKEKVAIDATNLREDLKQANQQFKNNVADDSKNLLDFNHATRHRLHGFDNVTIERMKQRPADLFVARDNHLDFQFVSGRSYISSSMYGVLTTLTTGEICKHQAYSAGIDLPYNALDVLILYKGNFTRLQTKGKTPMLTLWELLNNFSSSQKLTGNSQICCNQCQGETPGTYGKLVDATMENISYNIFEHKSHATLCINRGENKICHANVAVPEIVKSGSNYLCLSSVVEHRGSSGESGHYLCSLNCYADGWNLYDDKTVTHQQNGFGDVFQNTCTLNNSKIGRVYQYAKIGPTEYLYLKNNETIAIPSKENNKIIRNGEAHRLRYAIKYFCQSHNDGNDINIYESDENKIKSELEKIIVYQYPDGKNKNKLISVTLWDYFQDMNLELIFPYIFQLYKRNWDTWTYYELSQEKLIPEYLSNSYEYNLCFPLIQRWNNCNYKLDPIQQTVYDAINKKISSLQINNFQLNNFQAPAFNPTNQINNVKINSNLNKIEPNQNFISNEIQNKNAINNNFQVNNQSEINRIVNVGGVKDKNVSDNKIVMESKIPDKTNQSVNGSNVIGDAKNKSDLEDSDDNAEKNNENKIVIDNKIQISENNNSQIDISKTESRKNQEIDDDNNIKSETEIHDNKDNSSENKNIVIEKKIKIGKTNKDNDKDQETNSKVKTEKADASNKKIDTEQINFEKENTNEQQFEDKNNERNESKINKFENNEKKGSVKKSVNKNYENNLSPNKSRDEELDDPNKKTRQENENDDKKVNIEIQNESKDVNTDDQNKIVENHKSVDKKVIQEQANVEKNDINDRKINIEKNDTNNVNNDGNIIIYNKNIKTEGNKNEDTQIKTQTSSKRGENNNETENQLKLESENINTNSEKNKIDVIESADKKTLRLSSNTGKTETSKDNNFHSGNKTSIIDDKKTPHSNWKKISICLIIFGVIFLAASLALLLYEIYVAAIVLFATGPFFAVVSIILMIKIQLIKNTSSLRKKLNQIASHDQTVANTVTIQKNVKQERRHERVNNENLCMA